MSELIRLSQAITTTLQASMPELATVQALTVAEQHTLLPALIHTFTALQPGADPGDGRTCILASFEARILVDAQHPQAPLQAATLAARLTQLLRQQFWCLDFVEASSNASARPLANTDAVSVAVEWRVQWQQPVYLGDLQWPWPDQPPGTLLFAFSPDTGPAHSAAYQAPEDLA
ncbi:hypothetical protein G3435_16275 [Pseudomonas sp. MAFF212428]|uniref:Phage protein n=2 Tax=Pseudomonas brassicae TaxID=2708063 RepID=A0A6B3NS13_9PSED|nr:hypothetical protein [Pseudomonas brassicae]NER63208.1 hypothetical protein [Pseudomonas brassicae]